MRKDTPEYRAANAAREARRRAAAKASDPIAYYEAQRAANARSAAKRKSEDLQGFLEKRRKRDRKYYRKNLRRIRLRKRLQMREAARKNPALFAQRTEERRARRTEEEKKKAKADNRLWQQENADKIAIAGAKRKADKASAPGPHHTKEQRTKMFEEHGGLCFYCGAQATSLDHVVPLSRGGSDAIENCVPACRSCNSSKRNKLLSEWVKRPLYRSKIVLPFEDS